MSVKLPPFQAVFEAQRTDVYRFLVATAGPADADDCFQETWIIGAARVPAPAPDGQHSRLAAQDRAEQGDRRAPGRERGGRCPWRPCPTGPPRPRREPRARTPELWEAVRALPAKQRTAVYCRSVLGMPYDELAELLESSEEAARRNVHEGLKRLREEWDR